MDTTRIKLKKSFKTERTLETSYTGGAFRVTADERFLVTPSGEDVFVTQLDTGEVKHKLKGDTEPVTSLVVSPDNKTLVTASRSLQLRSWNLETGESVRNWKAHDGPITALAYDSSSTLVASGSSDHGVRIWDVEKGYCTHNFRGHRGVISVVMFHPDQNRWTLYTAADDCQIRIWDLLTRECTATLESHASVIRGLALSPNGWQLFSGGRDKIVNVWNLRKNELENTFPVFEGVEAMGSLALGVSFPGAKKVEKADDSGKRRKIDAPKEVPYYYTIGDKGVVRIWDLQTGSCIFTQKPPKNPKTTLLEAHYCPASAQIAVGTNDQNILFYDLEHFELTRHIIGYNDEIIDIACVDGDARIAVATNSDEIRVFDRMRFNSEVLYGHSEIVLCLNADPSGRTLVSGSKDKTARIWHLTAESDSSSEKEDAAERFRCAAVCTGHAEAIGAVAISRRSRSFVITGSQDRTVKLWDLSAVDLDGDEVARPHARFTERAHEKDINSIGVAPNDKIFATGSQDKTAKVWAVSDGSLLGTLKGHRRGIWNVQFSPVDQCLATASGDKTIKLWSLADYTCLKTFEGHSNSVLRVQFITHGMQLVSTGSDGLLKLWTIKTNECVGTFDGHIDKVWALAVPKDEKHVITGAGDSLLNVWKDITEEEEIERAQEMERRIIFEQDLSNFLLKKDYRNAILLAMRLEQPFRILKLFSEVIHARSHEDSISGSKEIDEIIGTLALTEIQKLLKYCRDWNTNSRQSHVAQIVLNLILRKYPSQQLLQVEGVRELINGLIPYTERRFNRLEKMLTQSYLVDYTVKLMDRA